MDIIFILCFVVLAVLGLAVIGIFLIAIDIFIFNTILGMKKSLFDLIESKLFN